MSKTFLIAGAVALATAAGAFWMSRSGPALPSLSTAAVAQEAGDKERPVLLICRSGKRTLDAGKALEAVGFKEVAHVVHGFEGELNDAFKRSSLNGWRFDGLPWEQM